MSDEMKYTVANPFFHEDEVLLQLIWRLQSIRIRYQANISILARIFDKLLVDTRVSQREVFLLCVGLSTP